MNALEAKRQQTCVSWVPWLFPLIIGRTKNLNGQQSETIGCEEAEKAKGFDGWNSSKYYALIGCTKVISI